MTDLGWGRKGRPLSNSVIFMQFSAKNLQNNILAHPPREIPPPGNPGSATDLFQLPHICRQILFVVLTLCFILRLQSISLLLEIAVDFNFGRIINVVEELRCH